MYCSVTLGTISTGFPLSAAYTYTYDNWDRPLQTTADLAAVTPNVITNEVWDIAGRRTELRAKVGTADDFKNNYTFDIIGRVTKITQQGQGGRTVVNKRAEYKYDAAGEVSSMERHRDLVVFSPVLSTTYNRDNLGLLTSMKHVKEKEEKRREKVSGTDP